MLTLYNKISMWLYEISLNGQPGRIQNVLEGQKFILQTESHLTTLSGAGHPAHQPLAAWNQPLPYKLRNLFGSSQIFLNSNPQTFTNDAATPSITPYPQSVVRTIRHSAINSLYFSFAKVRPAIHFTSYIVRHWSKNL